MFIKNYNVNEQTSIISPIQIIYVYSYLLNYSTIFTINLPANLERCYLSPAREASREVANPFAHFCFKTDIFDQYPTFLELSINVGV